jgi:hypothetical protein
MTDPRGRVPGRTSRRTSRRLVVVALTTFVLCAGGGAAWAAWVAAGPAAGPAGPVTSWTLPATATACTDTDEPPSETVEVAWPETSVPYALDYTATINEVSAPVTDDGATRTVVIDQALLEQLFGSPASGTLTVEVAAFLPGTSWTAPVATETVEAVVTEDPPGLTLECTS